MSRSGPTSPWLLSLTRLITSVPPAMTTSIVPDMTAWAAKCTACCDEPHWRSMVTAGTCSGNPATSAQLRPRLKACAPIWPTQPQMTSSTSAGSMPVRSTRPRSTWAPRSTGCTWLSPPPKRPIGVRTPSMMYASVMRRPPVALHRSPPAERHRFTLPAASCRREPALGVSKSPRPGPPDGRAAAPRPMPRSAYWSLRGLWRILLRTPQIATTPTGATLNYHIIERKLLFDTIVKDAHDAPPCADAAAAASPDGL